MINTDLNKCVKGVSILFITMWVKVYQGSRYVVTRQIMMYAVFLSKADNSLRIYCDGRARKIASDAILDIKIIIPEDIVDYLDADGNIAGPDIPSANAELGMTERFVYYKPGEKIRSE